jgi:hypothetical protein
MQSPRICTNPSHQIQADKALSDYYDNPNYCKMCGNVIEVRDGWKPSRARKKMFCNASCAARFNNRGINRWSDRPSVQTTSERFGVCEKCGEEFEHTKRANRSSLYYRRQYCDGCLVKIQSEKMSKRHRENGAENDFVTLIANGLTKAELKELTKKFGHHGYRAILNRHARRTYIAAGKPQHCAHCDFPYFQVCHIKDVKDFPDDATVIEINHPDNLLALCPNHHLLFDRGELNP